MIVLDSPMLEAIVASLGWTLLHFLWQGAVIGALFGIALAFAGGGAALVRYRIAMTAMLLLGICPVVTFIWLLPEAPVAAELATQLVVSAGSNAIDTTAAMTDWRMVVEPWVPYIVLIWALGVVLYTGRLLLEWRDIRRLSRVDVEPLPPDWQGRVARLTERLGVHKAVLVLQSTRVQVPLVVGWFKPLILVPVTAFTGLTPWQLELILMHELAHVRRHDYLVNLLQVVVETLLFYHPVVRWVSRVAREEREHCCDDVVVARSGDALSYARALAELAGAQSMRLQTSVGSDGGKLLTRIKRIVVAREPTRVSTHWSVGTMLGVLAVSVSSMLQPAVDADPADVESASISPARVAPPVIMEAPPLLGSRRDIVQVTVPSLPLPEAPQSDGAAEVLNAMAEAVSEAPGSVGAPEESPAEATDSVERDSQPQAGSAPQLPAAVEPAADEPAPAEVPAAISPVAPTPAPASAPALPGPAPENEAAQSAGSAVAPEKDSSPSGATARRISFRAPEFPLDARLQGIEGWVRFTYTIGRRGRVSDVRILDAEPRNVFDAAVKRAVRQWRFEPIMQNGRAVERDVTQTIEFALGRAVDQRESNHPMDCEPGTGTRLCP